VTSQNWGVTIGIRVKVTSSIPGGQLLRERLLLVA